MKNTLFAACLFFSSMAFAQTERNSWLVGGGLSLRTGENNSQFTFNPTAGMFVANNFALGASLNFDYSKFGDTKSNGFGIGPFARYYFGVAATRPFVVTEYNYETLNTTNSISNTEIKTNGSNFLFGLGFAAFVNRSIAIEGISGYSYSKFKNSAGSGGFNLRLGFGLYFNRKSMDELKTNVLE